MMTLAELFQHPPFAFGVGLGLGLWVAANVWIWRYARGYVAGIRYCVAELEPVRVEIAQMAGTHHVSEEMRRAIEAAQREGEETRH
jgi:hypothetical protein